MTVEQKAQDNHDAMIRMRCLELALAACQGSAYPTVIAVANHFGQFVSKSVVPPLPGVAA